MSIKEKGVKMLKHIVFITQKKLPSLNRLKKQSQKENVNIHYLLPEEETLISETIYITDQEDICKGLWEENANVLVWLHDENRSQNLGMVSFAIENLEELDYVYIKKIYQRYHNLPWTIAETKRCVIREMTEEDLDAIYEVYKGESITNYMEGLYEDREKEKEYTKSYIENAYRFYGYGTWIIVKKEDEKIIGRVGFNMRDGYEDVELGFVIMEEEQRNGYAFECCKKVIEVGKEEYEFERIQAFVQEGNHASKGLCEKLGFHRSTMETIEGKRYIKYIKILHSL